MLAQEGGNGLCQLVFRLAGDLRLAVLHEQYKAQYIAFGDDGGSYRGSVFVSCVGNKDAAILAAVLIDPAVFHDLFQLSADAFAQQLPLAAAGYCDNGVPVGDGGGSTAAFGQSLAELSGKVIQTAHEGILFKNDLALPTGVDLQRGALADTHGAPDLLGDDYPAQVVLMCQVKHKIFGALHRCFLLDFCATFMRVPRLPLAHSKYGNPSHTPQRHRRYHRGR